MTCDDAELFVTCAEEGPELAEHLATCAHCAAFAEQARALLEGAALPPVSASERAALSGLASATQHRWQAQQRRRTGVRRVLSLAMAACFGAAVASAALLPRAAVRPSATAATEPLPEWSLADLSQSVSSADDELEFEVSWPTAEGDVP